MAVVARWHRVKRHAYLLCALLGCGIVSYAAGVRLNHSHSMPWGLYLLQSGPYHRGDIVYACLPPSAAKLAKERGYIDWGMCPERTEPLFKRVLAMEGDTVRIDDKMLTVNAEAIPFPRFERDGENREMPRPPDGARGVWIGSTYNPKSYDSRYFGPIEPQFIKSRAIALWTE